MRSQRTLKTWRVTFEDGMVQDVDAFTKAEAKLLVTHGARIREVHQRYLDGRPWGSGAHLVPPNHEQKKGGR